MERCKLYVDMVGDGVWCVKIAKKLSRILRTVPKYS